MTCAVLKYQPSDFRVREILVPVFAARTASDFEYVTLKKTGLTTMEAVRILSREWEIAGTDIRYGGLKDEDGITEQLLSVPIRASSPTTWQYDQGSSRSMNVVHQGYGKDALAIGELEGNAFRVVVRNLDAGTTNELEALHKSNFFFLNYYDLQRFGVPGGVRRTHHVGRALLEDRWDDALAELAGLGAPESAMARQWTGPARAFFHEIDPRTTSFYLAAHASAEWNAELGAHVERVDPERYVARTFDGMSFRFFPSGEQVQKLIGQCADLAMPRYTFSGDSITLRSSERPTAIQCQLSFGLSREDPIYPGQRCIEIRFALPSGCYATMALRQLFPLSDLVTEPHRVEAVAG